jgi:alanine dehydrogenase
MRLQISTEVNMSEIKKNIGLPRMHLEPGERRVFLPDFVTSLIDMDYKVTLEHDYGSSLGLSDNDYLTDADQIRFSNLEEVYQQDYVLVLRYPGEKMVGKMKPDACLISMHHYPTRPKRVGILESLSLQAISLDTIKDDDGRRLVENLASVAWNGLKISFDQLRKVYPEPGFEHPQRPPIRVTLIGAGAVGQHVIQAAISYGDPKLRQNLAKLNVPGVMVNVIDYDLTNHAEVMKDIFSKTDILVDATQRPDPSKPVVPNNWLAWLPNHAVITDLAVDPYKLDTHPPVVRGIEGIPQGSLDKYLFNPDDPDWDLTVPKSIQSSQRRTVVSCYSWPGIFPQDCMEHYGKQLKPLMRRLINKGYDGLSLSGDYLERALYRGTLKDWIDNQPNHS